MTSSSVIVIVYVDVYERSKWSFY